MLPAVAGAEDDGELVVDLYSNSSSAPNRASSTFLRRPSDTARAMPALTTVSRSRRPKLRPLRCWGASRSATLASMSRYSGLGAEASAQRGILRKDRTLPTMMRAHDAHVHRFLRSLPQKESM